MSANEHGDAAAPARETKAERASDREWVVTRRFDASPPVVFEAWTRPELLKRWWAPKAFGVAFVSCEADVRPGGAYRFVMSHPASEQPMAFFGRYLEVQHPSRLVWTNEEGGQDGAVTTVTFTPTDGGARLEMRDLYASSQALDEAIASDALGGFCETFAQLDALLAARAG